MPNLDWFSVRFDDKDIFVRVEPPGKEPWSQQFTWDSIIRVCFKGQDLFYAAFGNKESLFKKVLNRYAAGPASYVRDALKEPTARAVAEKLLNEGVQILTNPANPRGCLAVQGALACGDDADCMRKELIRLRESLVTALRDRFQRAKSEGDLPKDSNPTDLARYLATMMHGLSVQAASGASRKDLQKVATLALAAWPTRK